MFTDTTCLIGIIDVKLLSPASKLLEGTDIFITTNRNHPRYSVVENLNFDTNTDTEYDKSSYFHSSSRTFDAKEGYLLIQISSLGILS
jgi:hypothetical protein